MARSLARSHVLIVPLVILFVVFVEEIIVYEMRAEVSNVSLRTLLIMVLYGPGIALFTEVLSPRLKRALVKARSGSRRWAGRMGTALFFVVAYGLAFYAYYLLETVGAGGFFPQRS